MNVSSRQLLNGIDPGEIMREAALMPFPWQEDFLRQRPHRALLCWARQFGGKSTALSAAILAQCFYRAPSLVIISSYTQEKSKDLLAKSIMLHAPYAQDFPLTIDSTEKKRFANGSEIRALSGKGGSPRGATATLVVFDEAAWTDDDLKSNAEATMGTTDGPLWAVSTPPELPEKWWWETWTAHGVCTAEEALALEDGWYRSLRPASECPNRNESFLRTARADNSEEIYMREYECRFPNAGVFSRRPFTAALIASIPHCEGAAFGS